LGSAVVHVLTVAKVTAGVAAGYADYLEGKTTNGQLGDYYLKDGERVEAPGRWVAGAQAVGCESGQRVSGEQLRALMAVTHPVTGEQLRRVGASGEAVAALDATFSAPKSVSAVWALADHELRPQIETAQELAVDRAIAYAAERVAMVRQRVDESRVAHVNARELVATSWRHTTARSVDGRAPDPQLHSHVLLHAAVRGDGRVVAIDSKAWLVHRREIGAAYRTELAHELSKLGYQIERGTGRGGRYFEIANVPRSLIDRWSSRSHQVQQAIDERLARRRADLEAAITRGGSEGDDARRVLSTMQKWGQLQPHEDRRLRVSTRQAKEPVTVADLDHEWLATAQGHGFDQLAVRAPAPTLTQPTDARRVESALTEFDATFSERDARAVALERSAGIPITDALGPLTELRATGELLTLADGRLTTRQHRRTERATVKAAERISARVVEPIPDDAVTYAAHTLDLRLGKSEGSLSPEQRHALETATGNQQLTVIEGQAGTGKSTVLQAIAVAHEDAGRQILVTSTAALAAERLADDLREVGVNAPAYSTAALAQAVSDEQIHLSPAVTMIHDEAALASTREQRRLLQAVEESGARLILVGDPRQNKPVGAGGLWERIEQTAHDRAARVTLTTNLRSRDPADQRDQANFRDGEHEQALHGYQERGRVHLAARQRQAEDQALEAAQQDRHAGRRTLVVTQTSNEHLDELNARAQAIRAQAGELGHDSIEISGRPYNLHAGDEIQIRKTIRHPEHGQLRNGTHAQILQIDPELHTARLRLPAGREIQLTQAQLERADARLAYVQHPFPAQGATTDTTHLIVAQHATREGSYVGLTRARDTTDIYASVDTDEHEADPVTAISATIGRAEPDLPSIATPLAHEQHIALEIDSAAMDQAPIRESEPEAERAVERDVGWEM
jgi:conjugative relaxase-like TrwC/TraI family protein